MSGSAQTCVVFGSLTRDYVCSKTKHQCVACFPQSQLNGCLPVNGPSFCVTPARRGLWLAGTILSDLTTEAVGKDSAGRPVYLREIWPDAREIQSVIDSSLDSTLFLRSYSDVFSGTAEWRAIEAQSGADFAWDAASTFIRRPPLFDDVPLNAEPPADIRGARILAMYGDMVTTEHVSPMGPSDR